MVVEEEGPEVRLRYLASGRSTPFNDGTAVTALGFSPDRRILASGNYDGHVLASADERELTRA